MVISAWALVCQVQDPASVLRESRRWTMPGRLPGGIVGLPFALESGLGQMLVEPG